MATMKQKQALDKIVENRGTSISKAMRDVGYADNTAKNPKNLTKSKGFDELCEERGLTDKLLLDSLVFDIEHKKKNRKSELELGFKVKNRLKDKPDVAITIQTPIYAGVSRYHSDQENIQPEPKD